ncbi:MAG TPA: TonB-dependent receptor [Acidobacteriaceae bacterium]|jgi:hypothetical protein|nr:TonB-dependent receptor [Acidobacteriaceae bacterium]
MTLLVLGVACATHGQTRRASAASALPPVTFTVVDQNGLAVPGALVTIEEPGQPPLRLITDYVGRCVWTPRTGSPYSVRIQKGGFYQTSSADVDPRDKTLRLTLTHQEVLQQEVSVHASTPGIDPDQIADKFALNVPEIVNIPFPTNRDIRNLLPFTPMVIADSSGQVHVAGGETWMTLDTLDGFDIRNPVYGTLDLRVSTDAVSSIDTQTTRYPVEYGRATGGVIAFTTGMGDNKFRYDATNFVPSFRDQNGIRFDTFEPRITFSGPIRRNRAWYFDAIDTQYSNIYIPELPSNANTDQLVRGANLLKFQTNLGAHNSLSPALLWNDYHSPYEGISATTPQESTDNHDILAWLPYMRDQQSFRNGIVLDSGFGDMRYREGFEPHGTLPYDLTPTVTSGSNFENQTTRSQRFEGYLNAFLPPHNWHGSHLFRTGVDIDHIRFTENVSFAPVNYLRDDGTLERQSTFPAFAPFARSNLETGIYLEDRWSPRGDLLVEPGLRFDWDNIVRRPLWSPRIAFNYSPDAATTFSAGIGVYYAHTDLEYLTRALAGIRYDTYYAADGTTPAGPPLETTFTEDDASLHQPRAINWSVGVHHELPGQVYLGASFMQKVTSNLFDYANPAGSGSLSGNWQLTNDRQDRYHAVEVDARRTFRGSYALFGSYTQSSATTNAAIDYVPTIPLLGPQQSGPLFWDVPNRVISWGWLPAWAPFFPSIHKNWDFVYTLDWHSGFPFDSINDNEEIVGPAGSHRFPTYLDFSPGLEWRFHFRGKYFGLRGTAENITDTQDPYVVFNNVDSPQYLTFTQPLGRAFTTRIRLITSSR